MIRQVFFVALFTTVIIAILLFALKNNQEVAVDLVVTRLDTIPLWAIMIVSFLVGIALASFLFIFVLISLYLNHRAVLKELAKARSRLETLETTTAPSQEQHP